MYPQQRWRKRRRRPSGGVYVTEDGGGVIGGEGGETHASWRNWSKKEATDKSGCGEREHILIGRETTGEALQRGGLSTVVGGAGKACM